MTGTDERAMGTALAGGVIATALLEALYDKGCLNRQEAREVLASAMISLGNVAQAEGGAFARRIVASLQSGKFAAGR